MKRKVLIFTGAGVSAESGVKTFRDNDGLWNDYKVEDVATIDAWHRDPQTVIDFYNFRKNEMINVIPNEGHNLIAKLEENFDVTIVTQNVDDLHEKAGSTNIIHLHGEISKLRSEYNIDTKITFTEDLKLGDLCPEGGQYRPDIVWFGEDLDFHKMEMTKLAAKSADVCIIVGTSMQVAPANGIPWLTKETALIYYVDPSDMNFYVPEYRRGFIYHIQKKASEGMLEVTRDLEEIYL
jgi:NAD-dependent deacetylase